MSKEFMVPTPHLRQVLRPHPFEEAPQLILQQMWLDHGTGDTQWRDVRTCLEEHTDYTQ